MRAVKLHGLDSAIEWQCAHNAVGHADLKQRIVLEYETPNGDLILAVTVRSGVVHVKKRDRV